jgi:hypothetical protein
VIIRFPSSLISLLSDCGSGPDEAGDRFGGFPDLLGRAIVAFGHRLGDAMAKVLIKQAERDSLQGPGYRGYLREDVDAVLVFVDHPLQAAYLALDPAKAAEVIVLVVGITVHFFFLVGFG